MADAAEKGAENAEMTPQDEVNRLIAESRLEERLSVYPDKLRLRDVAALAGISKTKVRDDARRGDLAIVRVKCGTRWMALVERVEAARYLSQLFHAA